MKTQSSDTAHPIYLDNAATTPLLPTVKTAIIDFINADYGNPSALHRLGTFARNQITAARQKIAQEINADPSEIIFTSGGSESNNTIIRTFSGCTVFTSNIEHPSVLKPATKYTHHISVPVNSSGRVDISTLKNAISMNISERTLSEGSQGVDFLISIMLANNEIGIINDVKNLCSEIKSLHPHAFFHTDATQAFGKMKIDVKDLGVDYLTLSGHKIGAPIGVGVLYVKTGAKFYPLITGGHQEKGLRAGTENILAIVGFSAALDYLSQEKMIEKYEKLRPLRDKLAYEIIAKVPHSNLNHPLENTLPHILNVSFAAAEGESIQLYLDLADNIIVSTGSACASGDGRPSHVLMALSHDAEVAHSSTRLSLGLDFSETDIPRIVNALKIHILKLQNISTIKT